MKRFVAVYIVDPDPQVPARDSVLYSSASPYFTDETDQEILAGIPVKDLLEKHNEKRAVIVDKSNRGDDRRFLELIRMRDLRMNVVVMASF